MLLVVIVAVVGVAAYYNMQPPLRSAQRTQVEQTTQPIKTANLKILTSVRLVPHGVLLVAEKEGFYRKYGLNVEVGDATSANVVRTVVSGDVQIGWAGGETALTSITQGADIVIVGNTYTQTDAALFVDPALIKTTSDLKGKTGAVTSPGSGQYSQLMAILQHINLRPADVNLVYVNGYSDIVIALASKKVDFGVLTVPYSLEAEKQGYKSIATAADAGVTSLYGTMVVTRTFLRENRDVLTRYLKAIMEAMYFMKTNQRAAMPYVTEWTGIKDQEVLSETYKRVIANVDPYFRTPKEAVEVVRDSLKGSLPAIAQVDSARFFDNSIVDELKPFVDSLYKK